MKGQNRELLELKSDWVFKRIFGKEGNEDILEDLLSAILKIDIKKIELKNTELLKNMEEQKKSILDIKAILNDNSIIDIEMQVNNEYNMIDRSIQYLTKLYSEQLEKGENYTKTKKIIIINILDYNLCKRNTYHSIIHLKYEDYEKDTFLKIYNQEDSTLTDKLEIHIIELRKFLKLKNMKNNKLIEWLQLISGNREMIEMALSKKAEKIEKAYKELQYLSQDEKAREEFDAYQRIKRDEQMKIAYAEKKGKIEVAKNLIKSNIPIDVIINSTGLTEKEVQDLKEELNS